MRMSTGVEWAAHACALLATLPEDRGLPAAALAAFHDLPPSYMAKQLQALSKAGLVRSLRGPRGGYRLARPAGAITLWDVAAAIEGSERGFVCQEIRRRGPCRSSPESCRTPCAIAAAFWAGEEAYREKLRSRRIGDLVREVARGADEPWRRRFSAWMAGAMSRESQTADNR
jgi:Rrf2 family protein